MNIFRRRGQDDPSDTMQDDGLTDAVPPTGEVTASASNASGAPDDPYAELGLSRDLFRTDTPPAPERAPAAVEAALAPDDCLPPRPLETEDSPFPARARLAGGQCAESGPPRRRIWDIDVEEPTCAGTGTPADRLTSGPTAALPGARDPGAPAPEIEDEVALARAQIARFSQAGIAPAAAQPSGRAKTRLLGFHQPAAQLDDPFARPAAQRGRSEPIFPVGWVVVTEGPGRGACFTLTSGVSTIGRGDDQTVCLDFGDTSISRQNHASVAFDDELERFFLGQGGKTNIVRLNGRPVLSTEDLSDGDTIRIGETTLRFVALCGDAFSWNDRRCNAEAVDGTPL